jgi:hypothetical protein
MVIRISVFLRIEHLTWAGYFSPSVDCGDQVDHYNDLKSCFLVMELIVEFNVLSKFGLGIEIGQLCAEIHLLSHHKTRTNAIFLDGRHGRDFIIAFFYTKDEPTIVPN